METNSPGHSGTYMLAVIIPCWNCADYIGDLMDCLLSQSFTEWEAYCVDDVCTDSTADIVRDYSGKDPRIHYCRRETLPKGAPTCRNIGLGMSEGARYVIFLDADDLIAPYCFEQRIRFMQTHPDVDFASFPMKAFKNSIYDDTYWGFGVPGRQELMLSLLYWKTLQIVVPSNIYRRDTLVGAGICWDEKLRSMQDADFNIQSLTKGLEHRFAEPSRIDYFYRTGLNSVSRRITEPSMFDSHLYLIDKVTRSFRRAFQSRYDFYLKAYIVNFFDLFKKDRAPYRSLLKLPFVKDCPLFFLQISLYLLSGMRGKKRLFKKYVSYSAASAKQWSALVSESIREKTAIETANG